MSGPFKVEGLKELDDALGQFTKPVAKAILVRTMKKAGQPVADHASGIAHRRTGALKLSAGVGTKLTRRQAKMHKRDNSKSFAEAFIGFGGLTQAITEEFGTVEVTANPMLRPAWDSGKMGVLEAIKTELGTEIMKTAARVANRAAKIRA